MKEVDKIKVRKTKATHDNLKELVQDLFPKEKKKAKEIENNKINKTKEA